uniref:TAF6_C domain-containing protein n=1 Tax=Caenorhabditis japonica TaxID=281687 RepID=A0A8R1HU56_CAEJA
MDFKERVGNYIVTGSRIFKTKEAVSRSEKEKNDVINQIAEKCVPKRFTPVIKREFREDSSQTEDINKAKRKCLENRDPSEITPEMSHPSAPLDDVISILSRSPAFSNLGSMLTQDGANLIGGCTRQILRAIIQNAKKTAIRENRKRVVPSDIDIAIGIANVDYELAFPLLKATPSSFRMYWGRKMTKPKKTIDANSQEIVAKEKFCDSIYIKDHWLVVEGVQPCVPENVVPSEVRQKFEEELQETQRLYGYGQPGVKREALPEKRVSTQTFSLEHQVLYTEVTNILITGTALQRQKILECIETDTGIQFLAGRFVILIAEGVRLHIGTRNVRGLSNLLKLTWSLMKNPNIRLEKYLYVLVPALISTVVSRSMVPIVDYSKVSGLKAKATVLPGSSELTNDDREKIVRDLEVEFRLREAAGRILVLLSEQYQSQNLNVRIIQILRKVLSGNHDPVSIYGVLCTFFAFGNLTIETVVLPRMHDIFCSLQSSRDDVLNSVRTTMTKMRKIIVESETKRMEVVQNKTVELIMKIIYENEIYNDRKMADRDAYVTLYAEFGALFYDYALNNEMIHETTGHLKVTRPSLIQNRKTFLIELEKMRKKKAAPIHQSNSMEMNDESMLDNLLDDSHRPWAKAATQMEDVDTSSSPLNEYKPTFFKSPKLFLIRKEKQKQADGGLTASYIRPLEHGYMPSLPFTRSGRKTVEAMAMARESALGQSMYASRASESLKASKESEELLRRFVDRPDEQAGAIIYGRNMMMSEKGQSTLDSAIAQAAAQLSTVRLSNAVAVGRSVVQKDEMSRGRFLTRPQTLHN